MLELFLLDRQLASLFMNILCSFSFSHSLFYWGGSGGCTPYPEFTPDINRGHLQHLIARGSHCTKFRNQEILSRQHFFKDQQYDFDLWPCDLKVNRGPILSRGIHFSMFGNFHCLVYRPTNQQVFQRGIKMCWGQGNWTIVHCKIKFLSPDGTVGCRIYSESKAEGVQWKWVNVK